jgi:hypothetical protein
MFIVDFLASTAGRITRVVIGVALIALGIALGGWWLLLLAPGALFLVTGILGVCLIGALVGRPLRGGRTA